MGKAPQRKPKSSAKLTTQKVTRPTAAQGQKRMLWRAAAMLTFAVLILTLIAGWGNWLWKRVGPYVQASEEYQLSPHAIEIHPAPPPWVRGDIRAEVFHGAGWEEPLSMLDDHLPERIADAFEFHPWVKQAKVALHYPARVEVTLTYRRPVAKVTVMNQAGDEQLVLDRTGVRLPELELTAKDLGRLPVIADVTGVRLPLVGQQSDEPRLRGAAEIAGVLSEEETDLGIEQILPLAVFQGEGTDRHQVYLLQSLAGRNYVWGASPSEAPASEPKPTEKIERLKAAMKHAHEYDLREGTTIDLRAPPSK